MTRSRLLLAGLVLVGVAQVVLARLTAARGGILAHRYALLAEVLVWGLLGAVGVAVALRLPSRSCLPVLLVIGLLTPVAALSRKAPLSDDLYRYAWDGIVQVHGTDPYRYPPDAEQLRALRVPWLFPPQQRTVLNRPSVRTIYPPVAEGWFTLEHLVVPLSTRDLGYELVGLLLVLAVLAVLLALLQDRRWVALWVLSPLPAVEAVENAHVDALAVLLVLLVLLAARRRPYLAVALLAAATLVKIYPGVLLPLLVGQRDRVRKVLLFGGLCALSYLPHVLAVGTQVVGYLPGYLREEHYGRGSRYLLLGLLGLSGTVASVVVALLLVGTVLLLVRARLSLPEAMTRLLVVLLLVVTPVQPWYALLLLGCLTAAGAWWALPVVLAAYPLYFAAVLDGDQVLLGRVGYLAAAMVSGRLLMESRRREVRRPA